MRILRYLRKPVVYVPLATGTSFAIYYYYKSPSLPVPYGTAQSRRPPPPWTPPSRSQMIHALKTGRMPAEERMKESEGGFDLLIVGGGATGAGVAVDAASRGLKVALVERDDFSAGKRMHVRGRCDLSCAGAVGSHIRHIFHARLSLAPFYFTPSHAALRRDIFQVN